MGCQFFDDSTKGAYRIMATSVQPRKKDHWSVRLRVKRPTTTGSWLIPLLLALVQTVLLFLTTTGQASSGALYGCSSPCGTPAQPTTPALAVIFGVLILLIPIVIGALSPSWQAAITLAAIPVLLAMILDAGAVLTPTITFTSGNAASPASSQKATSTSSIVSHIGTPFWLDSAHVWPILFGLGLFGLLAWFGWVARQATEQA
jgi:hypothetical protein